VKALMKLIHFEVRRFRWFLFGLMAMTALYQMAVTVVYALGERALRMPDPGRDPETIPGPMSVYHLLSRHQETYALPVLVCVVSLLLYAFVIWYRDWLGRGTFIYRLLMLPQPRAYLYLAKLAAMLLFIFSLLSLQLALLLVIEGIFSAIMPAEFRLEARFADLVAGNELFAFLLPVSPKVFLQYYGMGIVLLLAAFTAILLERSRRPAGIVLALAYAAAMLVIPFGVILAGATGLYESMGLYINEIMWTAVGVWLAGGAIAAWLGIRALNRNVSV